jgi:hypothetical protein
MQAPYPYWRVGSQWEGGIAHKNRDVLSKLFFYFGRQYPEQFGTRGGKRPLRIHSLHTIVA